MNSKAVKMMKQTVTPTSVDSAFFRSLDDNSSVEVYFPIAVS